MSLSVVIPSRNVPEWPFLQKTVDGIFDCATGEIEVIVVLDGFLPNPPLKPRENLTIIHHPVSLGMRPTINEGVSAAKGDFVMKCDDHCAFGEAFDEILAENCEMDWLVVPSRYALDGEKWMGGNKFPWKYGPIEYLYLTYPFLDDGQFGWGFHGKKWLGERGFTGPRKEDYFLRENQRRHIFVDDMLTFQGSCWMMPRALFHKIGGMQQEGYYDHQEAQELGFKVWLSGGQCKIVKHTWYAHLHKGKQHGRGYKILKHHQIKSNIYSADTWMNNRWPGQIRKLKWLVEHPSWWPLELWPEDWDNPERFKNYDYNSWLTRGGL